MSGKLKRRARMDFEVGGLEFRSQNIILRDHGMAGCGEGKDELSSGRRGSKPRKWAMKPPESKKRRNQKESK